jgi:uncharacterized protein
MTGARPHARPDARPDAQTDARSDGAPDRRVDARPDTPPATRPGTVLQGGRLKAYRPLPLDARTDAIRAGLAAYQHGDFFEAHELLEPAWMGTDQAAERELVQGLIKLAAAYVHDVRGNPPGLEKNLRGARERLVESMRLAANDVAGGWITEIPAPLAELDGPAILAEVDARLEALRLQSADVGLSPPPILHRLEEPQ